MTRWLSRHWLTLVTGLGAAVPVIVSTIRALAAGWMPVGDQGIIATRAYDVLTSHTPLLGQYSEASNVTGHATYSPGPMLYWLLAVPARVGAPASLTVTMAIVNIASIVGVVALARRRGGRPLMFGAAAAVAVMCASFSSESLHAIFNPAASLFPFTLLVFLCWSLACGDLRLLPLTVLVASFVVQGHLALAPPTLGLLAVGLVGLAASRDRVSLGRWTMIAAAVGAICWSAPLIDQAVHRPGNLARLATLATSGQKTQGAPEGWRALVRAVGVPPRWLRTPVEHATGSGGASGGDYGDTRLGDVWTVPSAAARGSGILVLAALLVVALAAWRRGRRDLAAGAIIGLVLCIALAAVVAATPDSAANTLGYTLWWGSVAGMWVWLILAWSAWAFLRGASRLPHLRIPAFGSILGLAAVAVAGAAVAAGEKADTHDPYYQPIRTIAARLDGALPPGQPVNLVQRGRAAIPIEPTIRYTLRRRGIRALGGGAVRAGAWYAVDHHRFQHVVSLNADARSPFRPATQVVRVFLRDATGRHRITVAVSPPAAAR